MPLKRRQPDDESARKRTCASQAETWFELLPRELRCMIASWAHPYDFPVMLAAGVIDADDVKPGRMQSVQLVDRIRHHLQYRVNDEHAAASHGEGALPTSGAEFLFTRYAVDAMNLYPVESQLWMCNLTIRAIETDAAYDPYEIINELLLSTSGFRQSSKAHRSIQASMKPYYKVLLGCFRAPMRVDDGQFTILHNAIVFKNQDIIALACEMGCVMDAYTDCHVDLFELISVASSSTQLQYFIDCDNMDNFDDDICHHIGVTPLMVAIGLKNVDIVRQLLVAGASIRTESGLPTVIQAAATAGSVEIVQMLLDVGADPFGHDLMGYTAADTARLYFPDQPIADLLEAATSLL